MHNKLMSSKVLLIKSIISMFILPAFLYAGSIELANLNPTNQTVDVLYDFSDGDVAGFQFDVSGLTLAGASGGDAESSGFDVAVGSSTVLGFSWTGGTVPSGAGVLTTLSYDSINDAEACVSSLVLTAPAGSAEYEAIQGHVFQQIRNYLQIYL